MTKPVYFDHIEVHVDDVPNYCEFLVKIFCGGRYKIISETGTSMFLSDDGINIEIKKRANDGPVICAGFCYPCLRMENAKDHIEKTLGIVIEKSLQNPDGPVYFFTDHEGIKWHIKEYLVRDAYINI